MSARAAFLRGLEGVDADSAPAAVAALQLAHGHALRTNGDRRAAIPCCARPLLEQCDAERAACARRPAPGATASG